MNGKLYDKPLYIGSVLSGGLRIEKEIDPFIELVKKGELLTLEYKFVWKRLGWFYVGHSMPFLYASSGGKILKIDTSNDTYAEFYFYRNAMTGESEIKQIGGEG